MPPPTSNQQITKSRDLHFTFLLSLPVHVNRGRMSGKTTLQPVAAGKRKSCVCVWLAAGRGIGDDCPVILLACMDLRVITQEGRERLKSN